MLEIVFINVSKALYATEFFLPHLELVAQSLKDTE
jgi:hypothetical protein